MWTYRVVRRVIDGEASYAIHEAYDDGDVTLPHSITETPSVVSAESEQALAELLERMLAALDRPVLAYDAFPAPPPGDAPAP